MIFSALRWHGLELSFAKWLILISLVSLLPMLGFSGLVVRRMLAANQAQEIASLQRRTALAAEAIGRELDHARTTARVVSLSNEAVRGDFHGLHALASRLVATDPTVELIALVQGDGQLVFSTSLPWGTVVARETLSTEEAGAVDHKLAVVSPILPMGRDGRFVVGIAQPFDVEGGPRHFMRVAIRQPGLSAALNGLRWSPDWTAQIIDQRMNIVARSRDEARFIGQAATADLQARIHAARTEPFSTINKEGQRTLAALARVPGSDWWVTAGLPEAGLEARAREPLLWLAGGGLVLVAVGVTAASLLGRELTRQVRQAARGEVRGELTVRELRQFEAQTRRTHEALHDARHDALTGLPSRALFLEQAGLLNASTKAAGTWALAVLFIDLDGFKELNDRLGHDVGDCKLVEFAGVLRHVARTGDCCGRLGGDEFVLALAAPWSELPHVYERIATRIVGGVAALGEGMGCSIGVACASAGSDLKTLLDLADQAMLRAKRSGKNRWELAAGPS